MTSTTGRVDDAPVTPSRPHFVPSSVPPCLDTSNQTTSPSDVVVPVLMTLEAYIADFPCLLNLIAFDTGTVNVVGSVCQKQIQWKLCYRCCIILQAIGNFQSRCHLFGGSGCDCTTYTLHPMHRDNC